MDPDVNEDQTQSNIVVNLTGVPTDTTKLTVTATLNGTAAPMNPTIDPPFQKFGFSVPYSTSGHLVLEASAADTDGCTKASGNTSTELPNALVEISLPVTAQSPRQCGLLAACAAGSICTDTSPSTEILYGTFALSPSDIWAVGFNGTTLHYDGQKWKKIPVPGSLNTYYLNAVWASGPNDVWAVGQLGLILRWDGTSWNLQTGGGSYDLNGAWGFNANDVWAVGSQGYTWHWNGSTWSAATSPTASTKISGVWGSATNDIWAAGAGGYILHYTGGTGSSAWASVSSPTTADLRYVWGRSASQVYITGASGNILRYDGSLWNRTVVTPGVTVNGIIGDANGIYAVGNGGNFFQSTAAPFGTFSLNTTNSVTTALYGITLGSNGIGWVAGASGFLGHFDTRP